jgi:hypothetical protein
VQTTAEFVTGQYDDREKEPLHSEIWNQTHNAMFNRSVFFLHKGPLARDSRSHVGLSHRLAIEAPAAPVASGLRLSFTLENTGEALWLHRNSEIFGIVRLASHLYSADRRLIDHDYSRHDLPKDVEPGEVLRLTVGVELPSDAGEYELVFDLVAEGVTRFENLGASAVRLRTRVS